MQNISLKQNKKGLHVAIDASRNRSGGSVAHLIGIINEGKPQLHGISEVHVWSYKSLLDKLPNKPWLKKHNPPLLEKSIIYQLFWQIFLFKYEFKKAECDILLNTDAGAMSPISPAVTMSRDMLSYETGEIQRYGIGTSRFRLLLLRYIQSASLRRADGAIFLTQYAADIIQKHCGKLSNIGLIPHGIGDNFRQQEKDNQRNKKSTEPLTLLYVSNIDLYKHQWHVVSAAELLYSKNYNIKLKLVGGGSGIAFDRLLKQVDKCDPQASFIEIFPFVAHKKIPELLNASDIFIFASSCENMPNTLLEAMAAGMPIACSDRGPMPEVLEDAGLYFNPEDPDTIASAIEKLINDNSLRSLLGDRAEHLSRNYSWGKCSNETWEFLKKTYTLVS